VALEALFKVYKHKNPGVEVLNAAVTGGGGSAARPVLQTRLTADNPPDTWQTHLGHELFGQYVLAEAVAWLEMVGCKEALKGSIPVRTDVDIGKLGAYQQWSMASFHHDALLASCVHGEAVPATFQQELNDAISLFVADRNVDRFAGALVQAARASGLSK
jgi:hypothetical protein